MVCGEASIYVFFKNVMVNEKEKSLVSFFPYIC